jgi:hypothetical protein
MRLKQKFLRLILVNTEVPRGTTNKVGSLQPVEDLERGTKWWEGEM